MSGPENPKRLRRNPQTYRLIDAKLLDHVYSVSVTSDILEEHTTFELLHCLSGEATFCREITEPEG